MWYTNGSVYTGDWVAGHREGKGRMEFPNLDVYEGEFRAGLPNGEGSYFYFSSKTTVRGTFKDGHVQRGEIITSTGVRLETEFRCGTPYGNGVYHANGMRQEGRHVDPRGDAATEPVRAEPEDPEASIEREAAEDAERLRKIREDEAREREAEEPEPEPEAGEEGAEAEKPDPREKELRELKPPEGYVRRTLTDALVQNAEQWPVVKPQWIPNAMPVPE